MTTACARRTAARTAREALACGGLRNRDEAADRSGTLLGPPAGPTPAQRVAWTVQAKRERERVLG